LDEYEHGSARQPIDDRSADETGSDDADGADRAVQSKEDRGAGDLVQKPGARRGLDPLTPG
jgi:hypothetical protein